MKKIYASIAASLLCIMGTTMTSCDDFLDYQPTAVIDEDTAFEHPEEMVTAAYAMLGDCWYTYPFNLFPYGDITSDDCLKGGSGTGDTNYHHLEIWSSLTSRNPDHMDELWYRLYCAISRCNRALVSLDRNGDAVMGADLANQRRAEVRFLRAHFYYKLITLWYRVPWIDEVVYANNTVEQTSNTQYTHEQLMQKLVDEFKFAYDILPEVQEDGGRVNRIAAAAYIAKCYLDMAWGDGYEATTGVGHINQQYMQKVVIYTGEVANSQYDYLEDFGDIFLPENKNSKEAVFEVQTSLYTEDNTKFGRANWSVVLNGAKDIWTYGHDFHKPSQNLVNAFKTENGLPIFDQYEDGNYEIDYPINGQPTAQKWDPRLFHTVGMPTFPYKYEEQYTLKLSNARTPNVYGYYNSMKEVPQRSKGESYHDTWEEFATADYVFRYTDVMLMRAEAMIETGDLAGARTIINDIRRRAGNSIAKHISYAADQCEIAEYPMSPYFDNKENARVCLRWERRLEMAMENCRYFDLRRWGIASETLTAYFANEVNDVYSCADKNGAPLEGATLDANGNAVPQTYATYYKDARYTTDKNEYFPIPYNQMFYMPGLYEQNRNYE